VHLPKENPGYAYVSSSRQRRIQEFQSMGSVEVLGGVSDIP